MSVIDKYIQRLFTKKGYPLTEAGMLKAIKENASKNYVYWAVITLREIGTKKSVPTLKTLWNYPKEDVMASSVYLISELAGAKETPFFAQLLSEPQYRTKEYAMWSLANVGDERALSAVMDYSKKVRAGKLRRYVLKDILAFLSRYQDKPEVKLEIEALLASKEKLIKATKWYQGEV